MIDRRLCLQALLPAWLLASRTQAADRMRRVGVLRSGTAPTSANDIQLVGVRDALQELGYVEGRNLVLTQRFAANDLARLPALVRELLDAKVEVIVAISAAATHAAMTHAPSTPVVFFANVDPVAMGFVSDLARPGGNVTGIVIAPDGTLAGKRVELLKAAVPQMTRMGLLLPDDVSPTVRTQAQETQRAAAVMGLRLTEVTAHDSDYARAFESFVRAGVGAVVVAGHSYFMRDRRAIIEQAARQRLPAIYEWREQVAEGGLMAYSTSLVGQVRRIATYVDRILKGAAPADLPVERPYRFELVINLKTAKALGLEIPRALLLRADEVIE
jgi:putative tryptophan/tyrosine transport system substrate-binding protein